MDATGDMAAAVEAAFSASTPDATTPASESPPASAIATPAAQGSAAASPPSESEPGPVPYARFKEVNELANLSKKELETLAWAKGIAPEHAPDLARFYARIRENPLTLLEEVEVLASRPDTSAAVRSWAARTLGTRLSSQPTLEEDVEPPPDIQLEDGRGVYSAQQLSKRDQWREQRFESRMDVKLKPLQETVNQTRARDTLAQIQRDAQAAAQREIGELAKEPHFEDLRKDIRAFMIADPNLSLDRAYGRALAAKIPELSQSKAATLQSKVGASAPSPSRQSGAAPAPPRDFREALEREFANHR